MLLRHKYFNEAGGADEAGGAGDNNLPAEGGDNNLPAEGGTAGYFDNLPETWRNELVTAAGYEGDELGKRIGQLERVSDVRTFAKNYFNAQDKIRSGQLSTGLPDDPTDEQLAEWRAAHNVPSDPEGYNREGVVLSEADERVLGEVHPIALKHNIPAPVMQEIVDQVLTARQKEQEILQDKDGIDKQTTDKTLRDTWGSDTKMNINAVAGLVNTLPQTTREAFMNARMPDGRAVFNDPGFVVAMADWARRLNPSATLVPGSDNPMQTIDDELAAMRKRMRDDEDGWHADEAAKKRYRDLIDAKTNMT